MIDIEDNNIITIYTDGGCYNNNPNKGLGAWAFVEYNNYDDNNIIDIHCGRVDKSTNNRTEMYAIINAIKHYPKHTSLRIISDSGYVVKGYNHPSYLDSWIKNNWTTSTGSKVMNQDLWYELLGLTYRYSIVFQLIRGHNKDRNMLHAYWNSLVDKTCTYIMKNNIMDDHMILQYDLMKKEFLFND